jgi:hypothetical protein
LLLQLRADEMDLKPPSVLKEWLLNSMRPEGVMSLQYAGDTIIFSPCILHTWLPLGELAVKYLRAPLHYDNENQRGCATYKA